MFWFLPKVFSRRECLWDQSFMLNSPLRSSAINFKKNVWIANVTESLWTFEAPQLWESIKQAIIRLSEWAKETRRTWICATRLHVARNLGINQWISFTISVMCHAFNLLRRLQWTAINGSGPWWMEDWQGWKIYHQFKQ